MDQINKLKVALNQKYLEREDLINGALTALISGEPMLILGLPGSAKSMIVRDICASIKGKYFETMMTKTTVPEELFGSFSIKALEQDKFYRNTAGKLPQSEVVFIDEVFKGSSTILNTLLNITNEKTFNNGGTVEQTPIRCLYAASNEIPQAEELGAFYDRMVLRYNVKYLQEESSIRKLFNGLDEVEFPELSVKYIDDLRAKSLKLQMSKEIIDNLLAIRKDIEKEGLVVSDRKWRQSVGLIKAQAILNGNTEVTADDLDILVNILWSSPDQIIKVRKIVAKHTNPLGEQIQGILDSSKSVYNDLMIKGQGNDVEVFQKLKSMRDKLAKMMKDHPGNQKLEAASKIVKGYYANIARDKIGLEIAENQ